MSDDSETWDLYRAQQQAERHGRRKKAKTDFELAELKAEEYGMTLVKKSDVHYQLSGPEWIQNIYPGNQRLYWDRNHSKPPFLKNLPAPWTLLDIVEASKR